MHRRRCDVRDRVSIRFIANVHDLAAGSDPNKPDPHAELCGALYGCGAHVAAAPLPPPTTSHWWFTLPVALGLLVAMRRQAVRGSGNR